MGNHYTLRALSTAQGTGIRGGLSARAKVKDQEASGRKGATAQEILFWVPTCGFFMFTIPNAVGRVAEVKEDL